MGMHRTAIDTAQRTYRFEPVCRKLGLAHLHPRTRIRHLRLLADTSGLPLPLNPRFRGGNEARFADCIGSKSVWDADRFDEWYDARTLDEAAGPAPSRSTNSPGRSIEDEMRRRTRGMGRAS